MKARPLSIIISKGMPNMEKILVSRKEITCSSCACLSGTTSVHLVKYSMAVKIKTCPVEDGGLIGPIKSRPHLEKGKLGRTGCKGMAKRCSFPMNFWHLLQYLEKL
jgi:hypothetical protein